MEAGVARYRRHRQKKELSPHLRDDSGARERVRGVAWGTSDGAIAVPTFKILSLRVYAGARKTNRSLDLIRSFQSIRDYDRWGLGYRYPEGHPNPTRRFPRFARIASRHAPRDSAHSGHRLVGSEETRG